MHLSRNTSYGRVVHTAALGVGVRKMRPNFVVTTFVFSLCPSEPYGMGWWELPCIQVHNTVVSGSRKRQPTHLVRFLVRSCVGPGGVGKFIFFECFFFNAGETSIAAAWAAPGGPLKSLATMFLQHYSTYCKHSFLPNTTFLGNLVADVYRRHGEKRIAVAWKPSERCTGDDGLQYPS